MDLPAYADLYPPTDPALLVGLWGAVSAVHRAQESCRRYFDLTETDTRLGDQLTLLPVVLDWVPASKPEALGLARALRAYADHRPDGPADLEAERVITFLKQMMRERGRTGIVP
ncbi:MAG: hypothetical protein ACJ72E_12145 [Marmoricola sp.]